MTAESARARKTGGLIFSSGLVKSVKIRGFKSLKKVSLPLSSINVLVGANGAGKSNFLGFFDMLGWMIHLRDFQRYAAINGTANELLFNGVKYTDWMSAELTFEEGQSLLGYSFALECRKDGRLFFLREQFFPAKATGRWRSIRRSGHEEAKINSIILEPAAESIRRTLKGCGFIYTLNDTSDGSVLRLGGEEDDALILRDDGRNLAPVLLHLKERHRRNYEEIVRMLREIVPSFQDFELEPAYNRVELRWRKKSKMTHGAHITSGGTLRLMVLVTLMNMPLSRVPNIVLLDEPELGLHPYAISLLGALIKRLGNHKQVIVATQSPLLVNEFAPKDIIVAETDDEGATSLKRLDAKELKHWLEEFQLGDLWQKNVIGGNP